MAIRQDDNLNYDYGMDSFNTGGRKKRGVDKLALLAVAERLGIPVDEALKAFGDSMQNKDSRRYDGPRYKDPLVGLGIVEEIGPDAEFATVSEHFEQAKKRDTLNRREAEAREFYPNEIAYMDRQKDEGNPKSRDEFYEILRENRREPFLMEELGQEKPPVAAWTPPPRRYPKREEKQKMAAWTPPPRRGGEYGGGLVEVEEEVVSQEDLKDRYDPMPKGDYDPVTDEGFIRTTNPNYNEEEEKMAIAAKLDELSGGSMAGIQEGKGGQIPQPPKRLNPNEMALVMEKGPTPERGEIRTASKAERSKALSDELIDPFAEEVTPKKQETPKREAATPTASAAQDVQQLADDEFFWDAIGATGVTALQNLVKGLDDAGKPRNREYKETMARLQRARDVRDIDAISTLNDNTAVARRAASDLASQTSGVANLAKRGFDAESKRRRRLPQIAKEQREIERLAREEAAAAKLASDKRNMDNRRQDLMEKSQSEDEMFRYNKLAQQEDAERRRREQVASEAQKDRDLKKELARQNAALQRSIAKMRAAGKEKKGGKKTGKRPQNQKDLKSMLDNSLRNFNTQVARNIDITNTKSGGQILRAMKQLADAAARVYKQENPDTEAYTLKQMAELQHLHSEAERLKALMLRPQQDKLDVKKEEYDFVPYVPPPKPDLMQS